MRVFFLGICWKYILKSEISFWKLIYWIRRIHVTSWVHRNRWNKIINVSLWNRFGLLDNFFPFIWILSTYFICQRFIFIYKYTKQVFCFNKLLFSLMKICMKRIHHLCHVWEKFNKISRYQILFWIYTKYLQFPVQEEWKVFDCLAAKVEQKALTGRLTMLFQNFW